jgi:hypothetical protein
MIIELLLGYWLLYPLNWLAGLSFLDGSVCLLYNHRYKEVYKKKKDSLWFLPEEGTVVLRKTKASKFQATETFNLKGC